MTLVSRPSSSQFSDAVLKAYFRAERAAHEQWVINVFARNNIFPALMKMTEQINTGESKSSELSASFSDSRNHTMTENAANELVAETAESARPDEGLCRQISTRQTIASARTSARANHEAITSSASDIMKGRTGTIGGDGPDTLNEREVHSYRTKYCNSGDMNSAVDCEASGALQNADVNPSTMYAHSTNPALGHINSADASNGVAQDYIKNLCNLKPIDNPPLYVADDPDYIEVRLRQERLQMAQSQCIENVASAMSLYSPGGEAMPDTMKATLLQSGLSEEQIEDQFYADGPSENELLKANMMSILTPASMADSITSDAGVRRQVNQNRILNMQISSKGLEAEEQSVRAMAVMVGAELNDRLEIISGNILQTSTQGGSR
ncbi:MAG: hypothetical protein CL565_01265 [Alphaproteobacteria bacterium]|nr:hypothetical protein [Alphaproteobacteria bacterium]